MPAVFDIILELVISFMLVFSVWAFGTTEDWSLRVSFICSGVIGVLHFLFLIPSVVGWFRNKRHRRAIPAGALALNFLFLGYCWISIWNAAAIYDSSNGVFYYLNHYSWLPSTFDQYASIHALISYGSLTLFFWGFRSWLLRSPHDPSDEHEVYRRGYFLPPRMYRILMLIVVNGALLSLECIIQRSANTSKLLWLVEPPIHKEAIAQFGPFAYRSNAAQYLNLVWPIGVALWWIAWKRSQMVPGAKFKFMVLIPLTLIIMAGVVISVSRGSILAMLAMMVSLLGCVHVWSRTRKGSRIFVPAAVTLVVVLLLGWIVQPQLKERLSDSQKASTIQRTAMYATGLKMAKDFPIFGSGPGTISSLFQLYRTSDKEYWPAQLHNDWLEFFVTWGGVGLSMALGMLGMILFGLHKRFGGFHLKPNLRQVILVSIGGSFIQAVFDFPFQIYSIQLMFVALCAVASVISSHVRTD